MIQLSGPYGNCTIINVYNDCITDNTTNSLNLYAEQNARTLFPNLQDHIIWLGDFNRHHPIWEDERNSHLLTTSYLTKAQSLITLITDNALFMPLPKNIPTLQALNTKNWTRVDNVFCSDHIAEYFIKCNTCPNKRGPSTDHVPIVTDPH
jgi:endonuclease/exonuclease/phosphatase family metal-dependent hydrolase